MRSKIEDYNAVVEAASKFTKSVAEGNSKYAKELFTEDACLFGFLNGTLERGSIEQFYHNVDTVGAGPDFKTRIDVLTLEETLAVVRVLEEGWGGSIDFTDVLLLLQLRQPVKSDVRRIVEDNYTSPVTLEDLAYLSGRSLSSFKRDFQSIFGEPPASWIREHRLNKARQMLQSSNMSVADVAYSLGF